MSFSPRQARRRRRLNIFESTDNTDNGNFFYKTFGHNVTEQPLLSAFPCWAGGNRLCGGYGKQATAVVSTARCIPLSHKRLGSGGPTKIFYSIATTFMTLQTVGSIIVGLPTVPFPRGLLTNFFFIFYCDSCVGVDV